MRSRPLVAPFVAPLLAGLLLASPTALPALAQERISVEIPYGAPEGPPAFEGLEAALAAHVGQAIALDLVLRPGSGPLEDAGEGEAGEPEDRFTLSGPDGGTIACGAGVENGQLGFVDNIESRYRLALRHPEHFHTSIELVIGDRLTFPDQSVICLTEGYTALRQTPLRVSGRYRVDRAEIPTQVQYLLTPLR